MPKSKNPFLQILLELKVELNVYLQNGICLVGILEDFNPYTLTLRSGSHETQLIFQRSIATIAPRREN